MKGEAIRKQGEGLGVQGCPQKGFWTARGYCESVWNEGLGKINGGKIKIQTLKICVQILVNLHCTPENIYPQLLACQKRVPGKILFSLMPSNHLDGLFHQPTNWAKYLSFLPLERGEQKYQTVFIRWKDHPYITLVPYLHTPGKIEASKLRFHKMDTPQLHFRL